MKKKLLIILIIILPTIFISNIVKNVISHTNQKNISLKDIIRYLYASKNEILTELGNDYLIVETGAEGVYHGLFFKDLGITITLDEENGKVLWIECNEKVDINGAKAGMTFSEIQKILGKGEIKQNWVETPENIVYELSYIFDKCIVFFQSYKKDGTNSTVFIMPNPSQWLSIKVSLKNLSSDIPWRGCPIPHGISVAQIYYNTVWNTEKLKDVHYYYKPGDFTPRAFFNEEGKLTYFKTPTIDWIVKCKEDIINSNSKSDLSLGAKIKLNLIAFA